MIDEAHRSVYQKYRAIFEYFDAYLVGLDREAAKRAFAVFLGGRSASANQIEFVNRIVDHLTEHGAMEPRRLYESPFTDVSPRGPEGLFASEQVDALIAVLHEIDARAAA